MTEQDFPTPLEIRALAEDYGYTERRDEASSTLFFQEGNNPSNTPSPSSPIRINVFYTTRGIMTQLPHPTQGYNSLWRSSAYDSLESLAMLFENPRVHTGKGYRQAKDAVRGCAKCGDQTTRDTYSANQWKAGPGKAICAGCVGAGRKSGGGSSAGSVSGRQNKENGGRNNNNNNSGGNSTNGNGAYEGSFPRLSADALQQHDKKQQHAKIKNNTERRQFNCPTCPEEGRGKNVFFKKVPANKPIVKCPKCKRANRGECERLYPIPKEDEKGYGLFRCTACKNTWGSTRAIGSIGQQCHVCELAGDAGRFVRPFRIEVPKNRKGVAGGGRRMKRQPREPIGEDEEASGAYAPSDSHRFHSGGGNALVGGGAGGFGGGGGGMGGGGSSFEWVETDSAASGFVPETAPAASRLSQYKAAHKCEGCVTGVCRSRRLPISGIHDVHDGNTVSTSASVLTNSEVDKGEFIDRDIDFDDWEEEDGAEVWVSVGSNGKMLRG